MRTYEEIQGDLSQATSISDAAALRSLATEMQALGTPLAEAAALRALGIAYRLTCDYSLALEHYRRALAVYEGQGDRAGVANATVGMGIVYQSTGDYPLSLEHFRRAMEVYIELDNRNGVANVTSNMGNVYKSTGDYPLALEHFRRALVMHEGLGNRAMAANVTGNMGIVYMSIGDYPLALDYYRRALVVHEEIDNRAGVAAVTGNMGIAYMSTGDYPLALEYYRRALVVHEEIDSRVGAANASGEMGRLYQLTGDYLQSLEHYRRALAVYDELGHQAGMATVTGNMGNVYKRTGDYSQALEHYRRALAVHERLGDRGGVARVTVNIVSVLMNHDRYDDAEELLERQAEMRMDDPGAKAQYKSNYAQLAEHHENLDAAHRYLTEALAITTEAGLRAESAEYHEKLRDLAQKRNDFAGYIEHNKEYQRITEEVRGKEATQRIAMMEAEKRIAAERAETEKHRALLYNTLPPSIADRVLRGEQVNDSFDNAAVMFMDMVGFTTMSATMDPNDVVRMLSEVFTACDAIMSEHGLMKIKTIGDSYLAVAFSIESSSGEQQVASIEERAARAACAMLQVMAERFPHIQVRIGLHCGPVTAGVIGTERLQYDVWGDTVNVASRMESSGAAGKIHVSSSFARSLAYARDDIGSTSLRGDVTVIPSDSEEQGTSSPFPVPCSLIKRGALEIKGKGTMTTYWLSDLQHHS